MLIAAFVDGAAADKNVPKNKKKLLSFRILTLKLNSSPNATAACDTSTNIPIQMKNRVTSLLRLLIQQTIDIRIAGNKTNDGSY